MQLLNSKYGVKEFYIVSKFEKKSDKNCDRESALEKKMQNSCHDIINFKMSKSEKNGPRKYLSDHL